MIFVVVLGLSGLGLVIAIAAVLLRPGELPSDAPPPPSEVVRATPPAPPSESEPPATPQASPTPDASPRRQPLGRRADLGELASQVEQIRELQLRKRLNSRLLEGSALADKVSELAFEEQDPDEARKTGQLLVALRLAPPGFRLGDVVEALYREQILGLYVPEEETLYVRRRGEDSPAQRMTTAHEITHALQDQAFDLVQMQADAEEDDDASLAVLALIEGDAVLTQQLWAQRHLTPQELLEAAGEAAGGEALDEAPAYLQASLFFPYSQGGLFVADLFRNGGHEAVDAAFSDPPTSTEQILHPERYRDRDEPVAVPVRVRPGPGWRRATTYQFGEFDLDQLLQPLGDETASAAAEGWDGGTVRSWSGEQGTAVAASLAFDSDEDAAQACEALPEWYATVADGESTGTGTYTGDRDHFAFRCDGDRVDFALAPTPQTARTLTSGP